METLKIIDMIKRRSLKKGGRIPDYDPDNPHHYHNPETGEKIILNDEAYELANKTEYTKAMLSNILKAVNEHNNGASEYNQFIGDLKRGYEYNIGNNYQNYRNFASSLPDGYSFTSEGIIIGPDGTPYVESGYKQSPRFTYNVDKPLQFDINQGKPNKRNLTFYPINTPKPQQGRVITKDELRTAQRKAYSEYVIPRTKFYGDRYYISSDTYDRVILNPNTNKITYTLKGKVVKVEPYNNNNKPTIFGRTKLIDTRRVVEPTKEEKIQNIRVPLFFAGGSLENVRNKRRRLESNGKLSY